MAKKAPISIIAAIILTVTLCISTGCSDRAKDTNQANEPELGVVSGAGVVEIIPSGTETPNVVLSSESKVKAFTDALEVENWKVVDKPQNQNVCCTIRLLSTETAKPGESFADKQLQEVGLITVFVHQSVICLSVSGLELYFEISSQTHSYLLEEASVSS